MSLTIGRLRRLVLVDLGRVDVDVNDRAVLAELLHFARHAIVKAHAKGQQQIRAGRDLFTVILAFFAGIRRSPPSWRTPRRACPASATRADAFPEMRRNP